MCAKLPEWDIDVSLYRKTNRHKACWDHFFFGICRCHNLQSVYTDRLIRDDIKANLQVNLILLLAEFDYPPVTIDDVYKEVLEQAENFKKYVK